MTGAVEPAHLRKGVNQKEDHGHGISPPFQTENRKSSKRGRFRAEPA